MKTKKIINEALVEAGEVGKEGVYVRFNVRYEDVSSLFGDNLEMYYDKRKETWVVCTPYGALISATNKCI